MARCAAFLRGINVGGRRPVRMEDLRSAFASLGFGNVRTLLQSGNVIFDAPGRGTKALGGRIEKALRVQLGLDVQVLVRTLAGIEKLVERDPFSGVTRSPQVKRYVTFLPRKSPGGLALPLVSPRGDVEVFHIEDLTAFSLSRKKKGRHGFPNNFVEAELGVQTTTRSWETVKRVCRAG